MKLVKVRCPGGLKIEAEECGIKAARCPANCPKKKSSSCFKNTFRYTVELNASVVPDVPYTAESAAQPSAPAATPASRPATPASRPATPASRPATPASRPATPASRPATPASRPATPASRPATPASRPATPASRPATPASRPATPASRPATPASRPATPTRTAPTPPPPPAPVKEPRVIEMADPFAAPATSDGIAMSDPFATPAPAPAPAPVRSSTASRSSSGTLDKYSAVVADRNSLFANLVPRAPEDPCFVDGAYFFYERRVAGRSSQGNSNAALRHIFRHWYISRVFSEDGKSYREEFLYLLKLRGFDKKEKELRDLIDDPTLTVSQKFFRVFYDVIYKNSIVGFYWSDEDSPLRQIDPRFVSPSDFYKKIAELNDPTSFLAGYEDCFEELMSFLRSGSTTGGESGRAWFISNFPLTMAEQTGRAYTVTESGGHLVIRSLGRLSDLSAHFAEPASLQEMEDRVHLFEHFSISRGRALLPRSAPLAVSHTSVTEDDCVYALTGLTELAASQAATAYNYYMTLLSEYVETFRPDSIKVGGMTFTRRNFYREISEAVVAACAHLTEHNRRHSPEEQQLHLIKSLFARGIFRDFERDCEADRLRELRRAFIERDTVDLATYFTFETEHKMLIDGRLTDIDGYVHSLLARDGIAFVRGLARKGDTVLDAYIAARTERADIARVSNEIEDLIRECENKLADLKRSV